MLSTIPLSSHSGVFTSVPLPHSLSAPASQLVDWARQLFYQEVSKPDELITLAKACMLIALEEEAAAALAQDQLDIRQTLRVSSAEPLLYAHPAQTSSRSAAAK